MASLGGYSRVREIGSGSYGRAILVKDAEGAPFVLKAIDISRMDSKERRDAVNEVRVLSSMRHPYIISYRESFLEGRTLCIVMDYAEGGDLYNRIARTRKAQQAFAEAQIVRWFTQASLAMKHLHERHVLHRDLKTQNLFLTTSGRLRIGDFGIAKVLDSTAAFAQTAIGTPYYLSPEICQERPYSFSNDVWAMGCILFEMAALRVPFDAANLKALVAKITRGPTPAFPSRYSPDLARLCGDLLQREEKRRPTSSDVLKYSIVQVEIRSMLKEEQARREPELPGPISARSDAPPLSGAGGAGAGAGGLAPPPSCGVGGWEHRCRGAPAAYAREYANAYAYAGGAVNAAPAGPVGMGGVVPSPVAAASPWAGFGGGGLGFDGRLAVYAGGSREATPKHGGA